jgi:hypothetical protein
VNYQQNNFAQIIALCGLLYFSNAYSDTPAKTYHCNYYANDAVEQHKKNLKFHCGYQSLRWSSNKGGQQKWCMTVRESISGKENNIRKEMLDRCFKEKTSLSNVKNHPKMPNRCRDPKGHYTPIKSIYSWYRYQREIRTPVKNGLITFDFNRDGRLDYVFIEQNKKQGVQLTTCFSHKNTNSYLRKPTSLSFSAKGDSLMSDGIDISQKGWQLHITRLYFEHNAGSSSANGYYNYNKHKQIFELKKTLNSSAGIPMAPDYTKAYPIHIPTLSKIL